MKPARFIGALIGLGIALTLQLRIGSLAPDFGLAALLTFSILLSFGELVTLTIFAALILGYEPTPSWEMAWFAMLPLLGALFGRFFALRAWAAHLVVLILGIFFFYLVNDAWFITRHPVLFGRLWLGGSLFGVLLFLFFHRVFFDREERLRG
jgi:hypothetical protein